MKTLSSLLNISVLVLTTLIMGLALASPSQAASRGYSAQLSAPAAATRMIAHDTVWSCDGAACKSASESSSRAEIVCAALAKKAGRLESFSANGTSFDAAKLEKCNSRARK